MIRPAQQAKSVVSQHRQPDFSIDPIFVQRWSPRAFDALPMSLADLHTILEAARWAPSAFNIQPWRFVYALRNDEHWETFLGLLDPFNEAWAHNASALVFVFSDTLTPAHGSSPARPSRTHSFDVTRQLSIPERYRVEIAVAIGRQALPTALPPALREREVTSNRTPLDQIAFDGRFVVDATYDGTSE